MADIEDYYLRKEVSNSDLSKIKRLTMPPSYQIDCELAFKFGRLIDVLITEPHKFNYATMSIGEDFYTQEDLDVAGNMKRAFMANPTCRNMLQQSQMQKVMTSRRLFSHRGWQYQLDVRCKWDLWLYAHLWGGDIKSTTATTQKQFEEACRYFDYDRQRAWYMDIAESRQDMLIGISKKNYNIFFVPVRRDDDFYCSGRDKYLDLSLTYYQAFGGPVAA